MGIAVVIHRERVDGHAAAALSGLIAESNPIEILLAGDQAVRCRGLEQPLEVDGVVRQVLAVRWSEHDNVARVGDRPIRALTVREAVLRQVMDPVLHIARGVNVDFRLVLDARGAPIRRRCQVAIVHGIILAGGAGERDILAQRKRFDVADLLRRDAGRRRVEAGIVAVEHGRIGVHVETGRRIRKAPADRRVVVR